ncbi:MAG: hypothetical protein WDN76_00135 [Alphaproteobacteria bacterium]
MRVGSAQLYRMRHREYSGQQFALYKRKRFWPEQGRIRFCACSGRAAPAVSAGSGPGARRAGRFITAMTPRRAFPSSSALRLMATIWFRPATLEWSNNTFLINRRFFLDHIIAECERRYNGRGVNDMPTIEVEANAPWWRNAGLRIGVGKGLFEHYRPAHAEKYGVRQSPHSAGENPSREF